MKYTKYANLKPSRVAWLANVPQHWTPKKITWLFELIGSGTTPPSGDESYYGGHIPWVNTGELEDCQILDTQKTVTQKALDTFSALSMYPSGTLLIALYGATIGKLGILGIEATTNQACCALARAHGIDTRFAFYWFMGSRKHIISLAYGGGQPNISQETIKHLRILLPPMEEQQTIVAFLDSKTAAIDALIREKERHIAKINEKRQALISHAVTRGINPTAPLRPSGVPWLGDIPQHWILTRLKFVASSIQTGPFGSQLHAEDYVDNGVPIINPANIENGCIVPNLKNTVDEEGYQRLERHALETGDIIFGRRGEMGRCAVVMPHEAGWLCGTGCLRVRLLKEKFVPTYLYFQLSLQGVKEQLILDSVGSTMDNLNTEILGNVVLALPPMSEQRDILIYLNREKARTDILTQAINAQIERLRQYRQALISEAVTGKIDVRGVEV